ncbi:MAG: molybdopterin-synthase adenylyltransferase MoeB, partial [Bacteroidota bacterium]
MKTDSQALSQQELHRYSRHLNLPDFGLEGQKRLKASKILVIGAGGLGTPLLQYLTAAGVGSLGIVEFDHVEVTNLQRQVIYKTAQVGKAKALLAAHWVKALNSHVEVHLHEVRLTRKNALRILANYDLIVDGTDNFPTRYLVNDACVLLGKPLIYASIYRFEGQVSVFNYRNSDGKLGPNYRDLFPTPPPPDLVPSCAEGGVLGVLPGIIGSMQALEAIKVATGVGEPLSGRLMLFDALDFSMRTLRLARDPDNPLNGDNPTITELIDYEEFCGINPDSKLSSSLVELPSLAVQELHRWREEKKPHQLIDVREPYEAAIVSLGGKLIPLEELKERASEISSNLPVVIHCR